MTREQIGGADLLRGSRFRLFTGQTHGSRPRRGRYRSLEPLGSTSMSTETKKHQRWHALDWFRAAATLLMVQGHAFYVVLAAEEKKAAWFTFHEWIHGLTAPMFLFASGAAFGMITFRKPEAFLKFERPLFRRFERYGILLILGYIMHWGIFRLSWFQGLTSSNLAYELRVDALQCIGVSLVVVQLALLLVRKPTAVLIASFIGACALIYFAPLVNGADYSDLSPFLYQYLTNSEGSLFPLFPWAAYLLFGVIGGGLFRRSDVRSLSIAVSLFVLFHFLQGPAGEVQRQLFGGEVQPATRISLILWRLSKIFGLLAFLFAVERFTKLGKIKTPKLISILSQETLFIYIVHLQVLYGKGGAWHHWRWKANVYEAWAYTTFVFVVSIGLAFGWNWLKKNRPSATKFMRRGALLSLFSYFFLA